MPVYAARCSSSNPTGTMQKEGSATAAHSEGRMGRSALGVAPDMSELRTAMQRPRLMIVAMSNAVSGSVEAN